MFIQSGTKSSKLLKQILIAISVIGLTISSAFCQTASQPEALASSNNAFALDLFHTMNKAGNLVFSPYSISTALAMAWTGARNNTDAQMAQALHFSGGQKKIGEEFQQLQKGLNDIGKQGDVELNIANSLWLSKDFQFSTQFLDDVKKNYSAKLSELDFNDTVSASNTINQWVEQKTNGKIKDLLKPRDLSSSGNEKMGMALVNAVYFLGNWVKRFEVKQTHPMPFYLQNGNPVTVQMMNQSNVFSLSRNEEAQVLELPYEGRELSMVLILPNKKDGLTALENNLTLEKLQGWLSTSRQEDVNVNIPKFKLTFGVIDLIPNLKSLGIADAYDIDKSDFSGMLSQKYSLLEKLCIKFVLHKAFISVDEKGTEAAAATAVGMFGIDVPAIMPIQFKADHPFLFLIRAKKTDNILFMGRMADPTFCQK